MVADMVFSSVNSNLLWVDIIAAITTKHEDVRRALRVKQELPDFMTASGSILWFWPHVSKYGADAIY